MTTTDGLSTDSGLLRRLSDPNNSEAWRTFVVRYRPLILSWCRRDGLGAEAAEDVLQDVSQRLRRRMRTFTYDPLRTFRGWLRRLVRNRVIDYLRDRDGREAAFTDARVDHPDQFADPAGPEPDTVGPDDEPHPLLRLAERVQAAVRARTSDRTWQAFWLADVDGVTIAEVAARLFAGDKNPYAAAYMARQRVRAMLREEGRKALEDREE